MIAAVRGKGDGLAKDYLQRSALQDKMHLYRLGDRRVDLIRNIIILLIR